jgi:catechol 2,3-dioxygenase-like lactoylglutathione lyase family enzyme
MPNIIGIGGVFLFAHDTERLAAWYTDHLGFALERMVAADQTVTYYQELYYRDLHDPNKKLHTVFAIMPTNQVLGEYRNQAMINYRVDDLDAFVQRLNDACIPTDPIHIGLDAEGQGKFTHLFDPERNRIELWEHIDA